MDKKTLAQYADLMQEEDEITERVEKLSSDIDRLEEKLVTLENEKVKDCVSGGEGGKQHFVIEGFPSREYAEKYHTLKLKEQRLRIERAELLDRRIKVALATKGIREFITTIPDPHTRRIMSLRFERQMSWEEVAVKMGGGNTADGVRKIVSRYLQRT